MGQKSLSWLFTYRPVGCFVLRRRLYEIRRGKSEIRKQDQFPDAQPRHETGMEEKTVSQICMGTKRWAYGDNQRAAGSLLSCWACATTQHSHFPEKGLNQALLGWSKRHQLGITGISSTPSQMRRLSSKKQFWYCVDGLFAELSRWGHSSAVRLHKHALPERLAGHNHGALSGMLSWWWLHSVFWHFLLFSTIKVMAGKSKRAGSVGSSHSVRERQVSDTNEEWARVLGRFGSDESPCVKNKFNVSIPNTSLLALNRRRLTGQCFLGQLCRPGRLWSLHCLREKGSGKKWASK